MQLVLSQFELIRECVTAVTDAFGHTDEELDFHIIVVCGDL